MTSSPKNLIVTLYKSKQTVFRLKDIALLLGETDFQSINRRINYAVKKGDLINLRKGIYAKDNFKEEELAGKIYSPSYLSLETVLQKAGIIFQYDSTYTSISYLSRFIEIGELKFKFRKIKNEILVNTSGINSSTNNISIANPERAFLDYIYLNGDIYIDNPAILNKKRIKELLPIYKSATLNLRVKKFI